jgi:predicted NAD/FAD-binding protein
MEPVDDIIYDCRIVGAWKLSDKDGNGKWILLDSNGVRREFDRVIFATQAGIARTILRAKPPIDIAKNVVFQNQSLMQTLGKFTCVPVRVVIHTEDSVMPKDTSSWKGLNVSTDGKETMGTIWMNYTHKLPVGTPDFFETSNLLVQPTPLISESKTISEYVFARSTVSKESCEGINELENLQGENSLYFVGSWVWPGMPLLEGCVASACRISERFGIARPWAVEGPEAQVWEETDLAEQPLVERFLNGQIAVDPTKESLFLPFYLVWIRSFLFITNMLVGTRKIISSKKVE